MSLGKTKTFTLYAPQKFGCKVVWPSALWHLGTVSSNITYWLHIISYFGRWPFSVQLGLFDEKKKDAYHLIPRFFAMVETQFNAKIQTFGYENAKELRFSDFFLKYRDIAPIFLCWTAWIEFSCGEETSTFVKCSASFIFSVSSAMSFSQNVFSQLHIWSIECPLHCCKTTHHMRFFLASRLTTHCYGWLVA